MLAFNAKFCSRHFTGNKMPRIFALTYYSAARRAARARRARKCPATQVSSLLRVLIVFQRLSLHFRLFCLAVRSSFFTQQRFNSTRILYASAFLLFFSFFSR